jgi:hypothetical protein
MELTEATFLYSIPPKPKTKMFVINVSFTISAQKKQRCPINATSARYTIQIYTNKLRSSEQKKKKGIMRKMSPLPAFRLSQIEEEGVAEDFAIQSASGISIATERTRSTV